MKEMRLGKGVLIHDENGYDFRIDGKTVKPDPVEREFTFSVDYHTLCMKLVLVSGLAEGTRRSSMDLCEELTQNEEMKQFFAGRPLCRTIVFEHPGYIYTYA